MLTSSFKNVRHHINTKRIQAEEFAISLLNSINLFTCALTHTEPTRTMVICTDYRSKDKFTNRTFLKYLYDNIPKKQ